MTQAIEVFSKQNAAALINKLIDGEVVNYFIQHAWSTVTEDSEVAHTVEYSQHWYAGRYEPEHHSICSQQTSIQGIETTKVEYECCERMCESTLSELTMPSDWCTFSDLKEAAEILNLNLQFIGGTSIIGTCENISIGDYYQHLADGGRPAFVAGL